MVKTEHFLCIVKNPIFRVLSVFRAFLRQNSINHRKGGHIRTQLDLLYRIEHVKTKSIRCFFFALGEPYYSWRVDDESLVFIADFWKIAISLSKVRRFRGHGLLQNGLVSLFPLCAFFRPCFSIQYSLLKSISLFVD